MKLDCESGRIRFYEYIESFANSESLRCMNFYSRLDGSAWHQPDRFPIVQELEDNFQEIRREAEALDPGLYHPEAEPLHRKGDWDVLLLYEKGRKHADNCARCPVTARLIENHRIVRSLAGLVYFSKMSPGAHIAPHSGPTNLRLRCHLAIEIPRGECAIRVSNETRRWKRGKCLVFNDYLEHESWNRTASSRLVLVADLWHPDLSTREIELINGIHRYAKFQAEGMNHYWAANTAARKNNAKQESRNALLKEFSRHH